MTSSAGAKQVTVVGGGLAGLVAAIACAEAGARVVVHEAHSKLGGRARSTAAPFVANDGTHAFYVGPAWQWMRKRGLVRPAARLGLRQLAGLRIRRAGRLRRTWPSGFIAMVTVGRRLHAPVDASFAEWAGARFGEQACQAAAGMLGPALYEADPGRLSAAFVFERLQRVAAVPPQTRYPLGGWGAVVNRMEVGARNRGVVFEMGSRLTELPSGGPVIVATSLQAARTLLNDDSLQWESGRAALLDVGVRHARGDLFALFDFDEGGMVERFSSQDPGLAPVGHELLQGEIPLRPDESKADGLCRLEVLFDLAFADWRDRACWRRDQMAAHRTGALDLPGRTWRDRPRIDRGDGCYLVGDMVAAPGLLAEVAINSAVKASQRAALS